MKEYIIAFILCLGLMFVGFQYAQNIQAPAKLGSDIGAEGFVRAASSTFVSLTTTSLQVAATNTARTYLRVTNTNTAGAIFCNADRGAPAVATSGIAVSPGGTVTFDPDDTNLYRGQLNCIGNGATPSVVTIFEHN